MNTKIKRIACLLLTVALLASALLMLPGCAGKNAHAPFGEYGYMGHYLTSFAVRKIDADTARIIVGGAARTTARQNGGVVFLSATQTAQPLSVTAGAFSDDVRNALLDRYAGVTITTRYYTEDKKKQQSQTHDFVGTDFKNILDNNEFTPYSRTRAKYVVVTPELIDAMEQENAAFKETAESKIAPFGSLYSYHKNEKGCLVIQFNSFAEIASTSGGIGSNFIQSSEALYDAEGKIQKWQTSLGLNIVNPAEGEDLKQGYILEAEFEWKLKT